MANISGTTTNDTLAGTGSDDVIRGLAGNDAISGADGNDAINGDEGNDSLEGGLGNDTLDGSAGLDWANYLNAAGAARINLSTGSAIDGDGGTDVLIGIENVAGSRFNDTITGDTNVNELSGEADNDAISGGEGNDSVMGGRGNDTLDGGIGIDWARYWNAAASANINLSTGSASDGDGGTDVLLAIENVHGSRFNDTITGDANANFLFGDDGNDSLSGGSGNDALEGGRGNDTLDGGPGFDSASYSNAATGVNINLGALSSADGDVLISIETAYGSNFNDTIVGDANANFLFGYDGNDTISGGDGGDTLEGSRGNDTLDGGSGLDRANYFNATGAANINLSTGSASDGEGGTDVLIAFENAYGSRFGDTITGDANTNVLSGDDGNDTITGGAGSDRMEGGRGSDVYFVEDAGDAVVEVDNAVASEMGDLAALELGGNIDRVVSSVDHTLGNFVENLDLQGAGPLKGTGNSLGNTINGGEGANVIAGLAGDDRLSGGAGNDTLDGGEGRDAAVFAGARSAYRITAKGLLNFDVAQNGAAGGTTGGTDGSDTLLGIERVEFADAKLAFDMGAGQSGANAVLVVGALMGKGALANAPLMTNAVAFFDAQGSLAAGCEVLVSAGVVAAIVGGAEPRALVTALVQNIVGAPVPSIIDALAPTVGTGPGLQTPAQLLAAAASLGLTSDMVGLTGLANTGLVLLAG